MVCRAGNRVRLKFRDSPCSGSLRAPGVPRAVSSQRERGGVAGDAWAAPGPGAGCSDLQMYSISTCSCVISEPDRLADVRLDAGGLAAIVPRAALPHGLDLALAPDGGLVKLHPAAVKNGIVVGWMELCWPDALDGQSAGPPGAPTRRGAQPRHPPRPTRLFFLRGFLMSLRRCGVRPRFFSMVALILRAPGAAGSSRGTCVSGKLYASFLARLDLSAPRWNVVGCEPGREVVGFPGQVSHMHPVCPSPHSPPPAESLRSNQPPLAALASQPTSPRRAGIPTKPPTPSHPWQP